MFIMNLLIPFTMIGFGKYFIKHAPSKINMVFGYRTNMSMKNKETWEFAHNYFGKIWYVWGLIMLIITALLMIFVIGKSVDEVGMAGGIICGMQLLFSVGSILPVEIALRNNFDKSGKRLS